MTIKRNDQHSTEFGLWLREVPELDSSLGYLATNIDFMWRNWKRSEWMLIEEKRHRAEMKTWQKLMFKVLDTAAKNDKTYKGFYFIQFENTSPVDGRIWINGKEVTRQQLVDLLQFK